MRNLVAVVLTVAMLMTTTAIALDLASLLGAHPQLAAPAPGNADRERLVAAFYDAANAIVADEMSVDLRGIISPEVVTHTVSGEPLTGPESLTDYLTRLALRGDLQFDLVRLIDNGDDIAAIVDARSKSGTSRDRVQGPLLWRAIDLFRIDRGMITGYWPGAVGQASPLPLAEATVPVSPGETGVSLTRIEFGSDAEAIALDAPYPHLLLVESGVIAVTRETALFIARAGDREFTPIPAAPGKEEMLRHGDAVLMTDGTGPTIRSAGETVTSALSMLVAPRARIYSQVHAFPTDIVTVMGMHDGWRVGRNLQWESGAVTETLAIGMMSDAAHAESVALRGEPIMLDPGQSLPPLPPGSMRLAIVRSGTASVTGLDRVADSPSYFAHDDLASSLRIDGVFWAGDAFTIETGKAPRIANEGSTRADILLIEVTPEDP